MSTDNAEAMRLQEEALKAKHGGALPGKGGADHLLRHAKKRHVFDSADHEIGKMDQARLKALNDEKLAKGAAATPTPQQ